MVAAGISLISCIRMADHPHTRCSEAVAYKKVTENVSAANIL
jgi:hypothetical protein